MIHVYGTSMARVVCTGVLLFLAGCSTPLPYRSVEPALDSFEPFELPLHVNASGVATLMVESSAGPLELILDTGADQAILLRTDSRAVDGLQRTGSQWKSNASGKLVRTPVYGIDEIQIGPLRYQDVAAPLEESEFPPFMPGDGVLGRGLFEGLTLDINMPAGTLGIYTAGALPPDIDDQRWIVAPLVSMDDGPVVHVWLDQSTVTRALVLDTGAIAIGEGGLYAMVELPDDLAAPHTAEDRPVYDAELVHLGDGAIGPISFFVVAHAQPPGTHGFLGNALFDTHRVVIDPAGMRVFIRPAGKRNAISS